MYSIRGKRIVVFGGTGFIARNLITRLARMRAYVTLFARHPERCQELGVLQRVRAVAGDVRDPLAVARALAGQQVAVNLVGVLAASPKPMRALHVDWPARLAEGGRDLDRIVHVGAAGAGASAPSLYLRTKAGGEAGIRQASAPWTIFAPSVVFGPGDSLFNRFAGLLKMAPVMPVVRPRARFSPVYVGDVAQAIIESLSRSEYAGQRVELGGPEVWTLRGIIDYTRRQLGIRRVLVNLPDPVARLQGACMGLLPGQPFSTDQYRSLTVDTDVGRAGISALGIEPQTVEEHVPRYLGAASLQRRLDSFRSEDPGSTSTP